jgi:hypothetical protein
MSCAFTSPAQPCSTQAHESVTCSPSYYVNARSGDNLLSMGAHIMTQP